MPDRPKDRILTVEDRDYVLDGAAVPDLFRDRVIYECGGAHDLHLDPGWGYHSTAVGRLLRAIRGFRARQPDAGIDETHAPMEAEDGQ